MSRRLLSDEHISYLKTIYRGIGNAECTELINKKFSTNFTVDQIRSQKKKLRLDSGLKSSFVKGQHFSVKTEFKKGQKPNNWLPVGTELKKADGYVYVKISDTKGVHPRFNWKQKHKIIWEEEYGPIPKGSYLLFLDGNRENIQLDNLACVTKAQMLILNKYKLIHSDPELTKSGKRLAELIDLVNKKSVKKR